jgi:hypothetical protein
MIINSQFQDVKAGLPVNENHPKSCIPSDVHVSFQYLI